MAVCSLLATAEIMKRRNAAHKVFGSSCGQSNRGHQNRSRDCSPPSLGLKHHYQPVSTFFDWCPGGVIATERERLIASETERCRRRRLWDRRRPGWICVVEKLLRATAYPLISLTIASKSKGSAFSQITSRFLPSLGNNGTRRDLVMSSFILNPQNASS
jgi:hypothetical protein